MNITDNSGTLSSDALYALNNQLTSSSYEGFVTVLSKDFSPSDLGTYIHDRADRLPLTADRLLMVVDLKAHKVRTLVGEGLTTKGVTADFLQRKVQQDYFVPYMKKGDLQSAISKSLNAVESKLTASIPAPYVAYPTVIQQSAPAAPMHINFNPMMGGFIFIAGVTLVGGAFFGKSLMSERLKDRRKQYEKSAADCADVAMELDAQDSEGATWFSMYNAMLANNRTYARTNNFFAKYEQAGSLAAEAENLTRAGRRTLESYRSKHSATRVKLPPTGGSNVTERRSVFSSSSKPTPTAPKVVEKVKKVNTVNTNIVIVDNSSSTPSESIFTSKKSSRSDDSDSGSSSWSGGGSSSSSSSDSGSSSWGSSSSSSYDSGSSSYDSGSSSGGSDSGSSGW